ncbi:MAG: hypothetical protein FVQ80_13080 [Planctomycetes bacterium]|nr:hypothetical protein [Planctomycetota bacterium]
MKQLVKLNKRPTWDGCGFTYFLRYEGENGKRRWETLGHANLRKAEKQPRNILPNGIQKHLLNGIC